MLAEIEADRQASKERGYLDSRCTCHHWRCLHDQGPCERNNCACQGFVHEDRLPADYGEQQIAILDAIGVEPGTPWEPPANVQAQTPDKAAFVTPLQAPDALAL